MYHLKAFKNQSSLIVIISIFLACAIISSVFSQDLPWNHPFSDLYFLCTAHSMGGNSRDMRSSGRFHNLFFPWFLAGHDHLQASTFESKDIHLHSCQCHNLQPKTAPPGSNLKQLKCPSDRFYLKRHFFLRHRMKKNQR